MGSAALKPSLAVGRLLRQRRKEMRLTLREVSERMADRGDRIPTSTLVRIEQGKLDPGVRRLHLLLRLYDLPAHLVADLVELEGLAVEPPAETDPEALFREGVECLQRGDVSSGLAYLFALRERVGNDDAGRLMRQKAILTFAVTARNLGKFRLARQLVDELLCEPPDPSLRVNVLVLASSLWRGLGSLDAALAFVRQAAAVVHEERPQEAAWVSHQEAKLLLQAGRPADGHAGVDRAVAHYRAAGDTYGELGALVLRVHLLEHEGRLEAAMDVAREIIDNAEKHEHARWVNAGRLELGRLQVLTGAVDEGLEALDEGLRHAVLIKDRHLEFSARYYLWKAHGSLGDRDRARFELQAAKYLVRFLDDYSPEADEVRAHLAE
jgi:tetratricopeptide (TPR) repeat protein